MGEERDQAKTLNKGHGRLEHRELTSSTMLNDHLDWPGVKQVCRLRRRTLRHGVWRTEVAYAITRVERDRADPVALLDWWRGHWGIENKLHWVRDEQLRPPTDEGGSRPKAVVKPLKTAAGYAACRHRRCWRE